MTGSSLKIIALITGLLACGSSNASISLQQLIKIAINHNPDLQSKKLEWQSTIQQYPQATALSDPSIVYTEAIDPIETRLGPQVRILSLQQKIPFPGQLGLKGEVVKKDIEIARARYDLASRNIIVSLKQSYYEAVYLKNAISFTQRNKQIVEKIAQLSTTGYANSTGTLNDIAKAQSQYAQVSYDVQLLEELLSTEKTRINTLLNRDPEFTFVLAASSHPPRLLKHSLKQLYTFAENNDEQKIADLAIEKSTVKRQLSQYTSFPDFKLGVQYAQINDSNIAGLDRSGDDALAVSIGMTIPLHYRKNKAVKHQAYLQRMKRIEEKKSLTNQLRNKIKGIYFKLNNSQRLIKLYQKNLIPQAQHARQLAEVHYRENKGSITQYLETQSTWLNFHLAYQRAIADYWKNLAAMEKLTGRVL